MSDDVPAVRETAEVSDRDALRTIIHYLYAPSSEAAAEVAAKLQRDGFRTEERMSADGVNWLVLARHDAVPTEDLMASTRRSMETLSAETGGEYDGWEIEIHSSNKGRH